MRHGCAVIRRRIPPIPASIYWLKFGYIAVFSHLPTFHLSICIRNSAPSHIHTFLRSFPRCMKNTQRTQDAVSNPPTGAFFMPALALPRRLGAPRFTQAASLVLPVAVAALAASAAYAGADTTFAPALTKFTLQ